MQCVQLNRDQSAKVLHGFQVEFDASQLEDLERLSVCNLVNLEDVELLVLLFELKFNFFEIWRCFNKIFERIQKIGI